MFGGMSSRGKRSRKNPTPNFFNTVGIPRLPYLSGRYYTDPNNPVSSTFTVVANRAYWVNFIVWESNTFDKISVYYSAASGVSSEVGLYTTSLDGSPGKALFIVSFNNKTGANTLDIPSKNQFLRQGHYYLASWCSSADTVRRTRGLYYSAQNFLGISSDIAASGANGWQQSGYTGGLPEDAPTAPGATGGSMPCVRVRSG